MSTVPTPSRSAETFEQAGPALLKRLRSAFAELIQASGAQPNPKSVADVFSIDRKLAWKLCHLADTDGTDLGRFVPGRVALKLVLTAAARLRISPSLQVRVREAVEEFHDLIDRHAGDRSTLEVLLAGQSDRASPSAAAAAVIDLQTRRNAFRANSGIWGICARTQFRSEIFVPSPGDKKRLDSISVRGFLGLCRLRGDGHWTLFRTAVIDDKLSPTAGVPRPLFAPTGTTAIPIVEPFSSDPLPPLSLRPVGSMPGWTDLLLGPGPVGLSSETDIVVADRLTAPVLRYSSEPPAKGSIAMRVRTPVETLIQDLIIERGIYPKFKPECCILDDLDSTASTPEARRLPVPVEIIHAGTLPEAAALPAIPRYRSLLRKVLSQAGLTDRTFDVYRVVLQYPVVPSAVLVQFPISPPSGE
jgi:hypothetical protein